MGNTPIELPTYQSGKVDDIPDGIPDLSTALESRSVLDVNVQEASLQVTGSVNPMKKSKLANVSHNHHTSDEDVMRARASRPRKDKVLSWAQVVVTGSKR